MSWKNRVARASGCNEASLVKAILRELNTPTLFPDTFAWRMETDGKPRKAADGNFFLTRNAGGRGKPDIGGVKSGRAFVMEVKRAGEKTKPHQAEWMIDYEARGKGRAFVVHSVVEAEEAWRQV